MQHLVLTVLLVVSLLSPVAAFGGNLGAFEADATKQTEPDEPREHRHHHHDEVSDGEAADLAAAAVGGIFGAITDASLAREGKYRGDDPSILALPPRRSGERLLPHLRVDIAAQHVEDQIRATDVRTEIGYGPLGGQVRYTRMWNDAEGQSLTATYLHLLWRMSLGANAELDFGGGGLVLDGESTTAGFSYTMPFQIHSDYFGIEFRPTWSNLNDNLIEDYDVAIVVGVPYVALRAGYRWLLADTESLHGPYAGISLSW